MVTTNQHSQPLGNPDNLPNSISLSVNRWWNCSSRLCCHKQQRKTTNKPDESESKRHCTTCQTAICVSDQDQTRAWTGYDVARTTSLLDSARICGSSLLPACSTVCRSRAQRLGMAVNCNREHRAEATTTKLRSEKIGSTDSSSMSSEYGNSNTRQPTVRRLASHPSRLVSEDKFCQRIDNSHPNFRRCERISPKRRMV